MYIRKGAGAKKKATMAFAYHSMVRQCRFFGVHLSTGSVNACVRSTTYMFWFSEAGDGCFSKVGDYRLDYIVKN